MSEQEEYLTATEVKNLLRISRSKIYDLIQTGELPSVKIGYNTIRIKRTDLDIYLAERSTPCS